MEQRIYRLLKELVAIESISCVRGEVEASDYIHDYFADFPYFKQHPEYLGQYDIPSDPLNRTVPYAFIRGNSPKTVVIMGHFDVVGVEDYGEAEALAFTIGDELEKTLSGMALDPESRADMESGEWIWGRGVADMKGGLAVNMVLMEDYAKRALDGELPGSLFFMGVPDEESYSAGMRAGVTLLRDFKERHGLDLKLLIDPEPCNVGENDIQQMNIGSVGKVMPVVVVQGVSAHAGYRFEGLSPLSILARIALATEETLEFTDHYKGEATLPPSWANFRDKKEVYDASIPHRAAGYMTVLSFTTTPSEVMEKVRAISIKAFDEAVVSIDRLYQEIKKVSEGEKKEKIEYETCVMTFGELKQALIEERGEAFEEHYASIYSDMSDKIAAGTINFPDATVEMIEQVLNFADYKKPLVVLGFAPPYYPAIHSDMIPGKAGSGTRVYERLAELSKEQFDQEVELVNYAMGISDLSYCALDRPFDTASYSENTPVWGDLYYIDFEGIEELNLPSILYGPKGKGYHQWIERLNKRSLFEVTPAITAQIIEEQWME